MLVSLLAQVNPQLLQVYKSLCDSTECRRKRPLLSGSNGAATTKEPAVEALLVSLDINRPMPIHADRGRRFLRDSPLNVRIRDI